MRRTLILSLTAMLLSIASCDEMAGELGSMVRQMQGPPQPLTSRAAEWLLGERLKINIPLAPDPVWIIEPGEVSALEFYTVSETAQPRVYQAKIHFTALAEGRGVEAYGLLRYRQGEGGDLQFVDFTPTDLLPIGAW